MGRRRTGGTARQRRGRQSRRRGGNYEREVAEAFRRLFPDAFRGLGQARASGEIPDVRGTPFWTECKNCQQLPIPRFLAHAREELHEYQQSHLYPGNASPYRAAILVARQNTRDPALRFDFVAMRLDDFLTLLALTNLPQGYRVQRAMRVNRGKQPPFPPPQLVRETPVGATTQVVEQPRLHQADNATVPPADTDL